MKTLLAALFAMAAALALAAPAAAHVLVTDTTNAVGAVLHVTPDDDPVAGEPAVLYFDLQEQNAQSPTGTTLRIRGEDGKEENVATAVSGTLVTAGYTFPERGVYKLSYTATIDGKAYTFERAQRVSRGATPGGSGGQSHAWAEVALIASGTGLAVLGIVAFNNRKAIVRQSKW